MTTLQFNQSLRQQNEPEALEKAKILFQAGHCTACMNQLKLFCLEYCAGKGDHFLLVETYHQEIKQLQKKKQPQPQQQPQQQEIVWNVLEKTVKYVVSLPRSNIWYHISNLCLKQLWDTTCISSTVSLLSHYIDLVVYNRAQVMDLEHLFVEVTKLVVMGKIDEWWKQMSVRDHHDHPVIHLFKKWSTIHPLYSTIGCLFFVLDYYYPSANRREPFFLFGERIHHSNWLSEEHANWTEQSNKWKQTVVLQKHSQIMSCLYQKWKEELNDYDDNPLIISYETNGTTIIVPSNQSVETYLLINYVTCVNNEHALIGKSPFWNQPQQYVFLKGPLSLANIQNQQYISKLKKYLDCLEYVPDHRIQLLPSQQYYYITPDLSFLKAFPENYHITTKNKTLMPIADRFPTSCDLSDYLKMYPLFFETNPKAKEQYCIILLFRKWLGITNTHHRNIYVAALSPDCIRMYSVDEWNAGRSITDSNWVDHTSEQHAKNVNLWMREVDWNPLLETWGKQLISIPTLPFVSSSQLSVTTLIRKLEELKSFFSSNNQNL